MLSRFGASRYLKFASISLLLLALIASGGELPYYDELYAVPPKDGKAGVPRSQYEKILKVYKKITRPKREAFAVAAREDLSKDNAVSILPRVLTESENHEINLGTEQRARAIHAFLKDYYSGGTRWKKIVPEEVLKKIIQRNGFEGMEKYVDPNNINFPYAVDLVRDANGKWRPLEDNPGYYGGPGDILKVREILKKRAPEMAAAVKAIDDPLDYPKNLVENIRKEVGPDGLVVFATQNFLTSDHEDKRMEGIYKKLGVEIFDPYDRRGYSNGSKMLVRKDGVYLKQAGEKSARKVDFVILNLEPGTWDYVPLAFRRMAILETADWYLEDSDPNKKRHISLEKKEKIKKALLPDEKTGQVDHEKVQSTMKSLGLETTLDGFPKGEVPNLWDAVRKGKVKTNYSPGIDFVGDKEFYVYVDELIRQYLYEEPIFENVRTVSLATKDKKRKMDSQ